MLRYQQLRLQSHRYTSSTTLRMHGALPTRHVLYLCVAVKEVVSLRDCGWQHVCQHHTTLDNAANNSWLEVDEAMASGAALH